MSNEQAAVLARAQAAKAAYRDNPTDETQAGHKAAAEELRYTRWLERGGPASFRQAVQQRRKQNEALEQAGLPTITTPLRDEHLYARWSAENEEG